LTAKRELRSQALPKIPVQRQAVVFEPIALCPVDFFVLRKLCGDIKNVAAGEFLDGKA